MAAKRKPDAGGETGKPKDSAPSGAEAVEDGATTVRRGLGAPPPKKA